MKKLLVKDWFHEKQMNEKGRDVQTTEIFGIIKESAKAMYVMVGTPNARMCYWVPKSCVYEADDTLAQYENWEGTQDFTEYGDKAYEECAWHFESEMAYYR